MPAILSGIRAARQGNSSNRYLAWDSIQIASALASGILLPLSLATNKGGITLEPLWIALCLLGLLDIAISSRRPYNEKGQTIRDKKKIRSRYAKRWLAWDALSNLPPLLFPGSAACALLQIVRCTKLLRITRTWEREGQTNSLVLRILRYLLSLLILVTWLSSVWLYLGMTDPSAEGWITRNGFTSKSTADKLLLSVHWTVTTLTSVGYGDIAPRTRPELIIGLITMCTGVGVIAFAIGNIINVIKQLDNGRSDYEMKQAGMRRYLAVNGVQPDTILRFQQFGNFLWDNYRGVTPSLLLSELPISLRRIITEEIMAEAIKSIPLLREASFHLRSNLMMHMKAEVFQPGGMILPEDEIGDEIVFITSGRASIESEQLKQINIEATFGPGDHFGELSFFLEERRNCRVVAIDYVQAFVLERTAYNDICRKDSSFKNVLKAIANERAAVKQELLLNGVVI